ncbi:hypothetical protein BDV33DRAFT_185365 [Aspergillus novoparasiticus]|uniref:Uncharacterized protein n=1 Tax=Aspergillus novoparasiticus TaxID=986946 RepID=A0A5N6E753_9EURO|nr:hypothetical protein BDV33DRAFT_185365 [Aspergillus novoparasiticus]
MVFLSMSPRDPLTVTALDNSLLLPGLKILTRSNNTLFTDVAVVVDDVNCDNPI